jgi:hypothetical protein
MTTGYVTRGSEIDVRLIEQVDPSSRPVDRIIRLDSVSSELIQFSPISQPDSVFYQNIQQQSADTPTSNSTFNFNVSTFNFNVPTLRIDAMPLNYAEIILDPPTSDPNTPSPSPMTRSRSVRSNPSYTTIDVNKTRLTHFGMLFEFSFLWTNSDLYSLKLCVWVLGARERGVCFGMVVRIWLWIRQQYS